MNENERAEPEWTKEHTGAPPAAWSLDGPMKGAGGAPSEVTTFHRREGLDDDVPWSPDVFVLGGSGTAGSPFVGELIPGGTAGAETDPLEALASALRELTLRGALFTTWWVAGAPAPSSIRVRQISAVHGTPAKARLELSSPAGPGMIETPDTPH